RALRADHGAGRGGARVGRRPRRQSGTEVRDIVQAVGPVAGHVEDLAAGGAAQIEDEVEPAVVAVEEQAARQVGDGAPRVVAVVITDSAVAVPVYVAHVTGLRAGLRTCLDLGRVLEDAVGLE